MENMFNIAAQYKDNIRKDVLFRGVKWQPAYFLPTDKQTIVAFLYQLVRKDHVFLNRRFWKLDIVKGFQE